MAELRDTGGRARLEALFEQFQQDIPKAVLEPTAQALAQAVAERAPTPEEERATMLYGVFGSTEVGPDGVDSDGRQRFIKPYENYLRNFLPHSFAVDGLYAGVGNLAQLSAISAYEYVNVATDTRFGSDGRVLGTYRHEVTRPFWMNWEFGGIFNIFPNDYGVGYGGMKLKPTPDKSSWTWEMTKVIPSRRMFMGVNQEQISDAIFFERLKATFGGNWRIRE